MTKIPRFFLLLCFALTTLAVPQTHATSLSEYAKDLANPTKQREALEQLKNLADPSFRGLLRALKDGALYRWNNKFLILDESGNYVDLSGQRLLDASGQPLVPQGGLEAVPLDETNIPILQKALDFTDLLDANPETRKSVAERLGALGDPSVISALAKAFDREKNSHVKAVLQETMARLKLSDPDPRVRDEGVQFFLKHPSESVLGPLKDMVSREQDPRVQMAIQQAIDRIERHLKFRNAIGYLFNGLSLTSVLLIMSLGLAITFGLMGIINMAHGEMLMLGSYTAYVLQQIFASRFPSHADLYFFAALPLSFLIVGLVGFVLERGILRFLYGRPLESLLVTWGIGMVLSQGVRLYFGDQTSVNQPTRFRGGWEALPGLVLPYSRIFIIFLSLICLLAVYFLLYKSWTGLKIRAVMQNRDMAACMGISTRKIDAFTFALGTAMAGIGGCALALVGTVDPEVGKTYIVDAFMVVVLGGVGKLMGTVLASSVIGMANKIMEPLIPGTAAAIYAKVGVLVVVILFLQYKPTGIFAAKGRAAENQVL